MDYISNEEDMDAGEEERIIFKEVPIKKGEEMIVEIDSEKEFTAQIIEKENGTKINYDNHLSTEDLGNITITTEVEGIGNAAPTCNLTYGDATVLSATTDENNEFLGWYDKDGELLSKEADYPIIATKNKIYVAKFTNNYIPTTGVKMTSKLYMKSGDIKFLDAEVIPSNATYQLCTIN